MTLQCNEGSGRRLCRKSVPGLQTEFIERKKKAGMGRVFNLETGGGPDIAYHYKGDNVYIAV